MNPRPIAVKPLKNYELLITFKNGEKKVFDMKPLLSSPLPSSLFLSSPLPTSVLLFLPLFSLPLLWLP